jgi:hypothetical protein
VHDVAFEHVTIVPADIDSSGRPSNGHVKLKPVPARFNAEETKDSPASLHWWHRRLIVTLAGPAAHKKLHPHAHPFGYAMADIGEADRVIRDIQQCDGPVVNAHYKYIEALATACIENNWKEIEAVAAAPIERGTLSSDQVRDAMLPHQEVGASDRRLTVTLTGAISGVLKSASRSLRAQTLGYWSKQV